MSKHQARTFGNTHVSVSFVPNTKVAHHLLVLQNSTRCVERSCSNLESIFLFFPLQIQQHTRPNKPLRQVQ
jgi:hypothetical protein